MSTPAEPTPATTPAVAAAEAAPAASTEAVAAGEPVAAAEPSPAEPVAAEPTPAEPPAFPSYDEFQWPDEIDEEFSAFDERVRPYLSGYRERLTGEHQKALSERDERLTTLQSDVDSWRGAYETIMSGREDPRIGEAEAALAALQEKFDAQAADLAESNRIWDERVEHDNRLYLQWFRENYNDTPADVQEKALTFYESLEENPDVEPHVAFDIAKLGDDAIVHAKGLFARQLPSDVVLKLTQHAFGAGPRPTPNRPNPSAQLVEGAPTNVKPTSPKPRLVDLSLNEQKTRVLDELFR